MFALPFSRRALFRAGGIALVGTALAPETSWALRIEDSETPNEHAVRKYYKAWETKDWTPFDEVLADDFTFTSANDDDHISKAAFKTECWDTQIDFIRNFDLEAVLVNGNEAFVKYLCHTKNDRSFRNTEYLRLRDYRIVAIECYFGAKSSFASVAAAKS